MSCQRCHSWICQCPPPIIVENTELITQQAERIATLEQQNAELAAALGMLIDLHDAAGMPAGPIRNNAQKTIAKVKQP